MKSVRHILPIALVVTLSGCGTVMSTPPSGFLSDYSALASTPDATASSRTSTLPINPALVSISEVVWRVEPRADISNDERDALLAQFRRELQQALVMLPASPKGRPAHIRAAITRVETVSPALNTVGTLLLIGPLDRGGAAIEIEAIDPENRQQLAALQLGHFSPLSDIKARFSKLAPAEIALHKAAADFAALLAPTATMKPPSH